MTQRQAAEIAREMAGFHAAEWRTSAGDRRVEQIHGAVFDQAFEFIPDSAVAALIQRDGDNEPVIVAIDGHQLYVLSVLPAENGSPQPATECRIIHVEPGGGSVTVRTRYRPAIGTRPSRSTTWKFKVADEITMTIETSFHPEDEIEAREAVAQGLARALGWQTSTPRAGQVAVTAAA